MTGQDRTGSSLLDVRMNDRQSSVRRQFRARIWLPVEPFFGREIEEIILYFKPSLPTHDWSVIFPERAGAPYRRALILLNVESVGLLSETKVP